MMSSMTTRPPGRTTRAISRMAMRGEGRGVGGRGGAEVPCEGDDALHAGGEGEGEDAAAGVEHAVAAAGAHKGDEAADSLRVGDDAGDGHGRRGRRGRGSAFVSMSMGGGGGFEPPASWKGTVLIQDMLLLLQGQRRT